MKKIFPLYCDIDARDCLFLFFPHLGKSVSIPSFTQISASEFPNLTPMIASVCISHSPLGNT